MLYSSRFFIIIHLIVEYISTPESVPITTHPSHVEVRSCRYTYSLYGILLFIIHLNSGDNIIRLESSNEAMTVPLTPSS